MAKTQRLLPLAGLAMIFCAISAWGQTKTMHADIPFPFHVADKHFDAGDYEVIVGYPSPHTFTVTSFATREGALGFFWDAKTRDSSALQPRLVFTKYGRDEYFLSEIWHPWASSSMKLPRSKQEVVTSKLVAGVRPEKVVIWAALRLP